MCQEEGFATGENISVSLKNIGKIFEKPFSLVIFVDSIGAALDEICGQACEALSRSGKLPAVIGIGNASVAKKPDITVLEKELPFRSLSHFPCEFHPRLSQLRFLDEILFSSNLSFCSPDAPGVQSVMRLRNFLAAGIPDSARPLVWNQPERGLHPHWQVLMCSALAQIAAPETPVVLSTYSPYIVQGMRHHLYQQPDSMQCWRVCLEPEEKTIALQDISDDLNLCFAQFADPLHNIMNPPA